MSLSLALQDPHVVQSGESQCPGSLNISSTSSECPSCFHIPNMQLAMQLTCKQELYLEIAGISVCPSNMSCYALDLAFVCTSTTRGNPHCARKSHTRKAKHSILHLLASIYTKHQKASAHDMGPRLLLQQRSYTYRVCKISKSLCWRQA